MEKVTLGQTGKPRIHSRDQSPFRITAIPAGWYPDPPGVLHKNAPLSKLDGSYVGRKPLGQSLHHLLFVAKSAQIPSNFRLPFDEVTFFHHGFLNFLNNP